ncbi:MAG: hypothetical protein K9H64_22495 [Bacteroidales bacterium]|nr:hypothetical protein [Bacteroidales bacterium]MCF8458807.1 hypothetical protein [Bacteroidales bacterium]
MSYSKSVNIKIMPSLDGKYFVIPFPAPQPLQANCAGYWDDKKQSHEKPVFRFVTPTNEYFYGRFETMLKYKFRLKGQDGQGMDYPPQSLTLLSWGLHPLEFQIEFMKHYEDIFDPKSGKVAFMFFKKITSSNQ